MNVMYNMSVCIAVYYNKIFAVRWWEAARREKTLGERWAAVIKTINSILWTSVAFNGRSPEWGQSRSQYMARRGPWRTYSRGASRRLNPKYVHSQYMHVVCNEIHNFVTYVLVWPMSISLIIPGVYFSQVKNKPWIPWVYTWSWHRREQIPHTLCI
jgi:hypothetical protein